MLCVCVCVNRDRTTLWTHTHNARPAVAPRARPRCAHTQHFGGGICRSAARAGSACRERLVEGLTCGPPLVPPLPPSLRTPYR